MNTSVRTPSRATLPDLYKGVIFGFTARNGYLDSPEGRAQVDKMVECGVEWVGVSVTMWMESYASTRVFCDYERSCNQAELERMIELIHSRGMKVMLYLCIELFDGRWRGDVRMPQEVMQIGARNPHYAADWFASYTACCLNYARMGERLGVELISLGAEYEGMVRYEEEWATLIKQVREVYTGSLTFEAHAGHLGDVRNHPALKCQWYKLLDVIGFSFYRPAADRPGTTKEEMKAYLKPSVEIMKWLSEMTGLPLVFTECGCRPRVGGAMSPGDYLAQGTYDGAEQANYMAAVLETFQNEPWWRGVFWWKWEEQNKATRPQYYTDPAGDMGLDFYGKPAADVFRQWKAKRSS